MCGSPLSKCTRPSNRIALAPVHVRGKIIFPGLRRVLKRTKFVEIKDEGLVHLQRVAAFKSVLETKTSSHTCSGERRNSDASAIQCDIGASTRHGERGDNFVSTGQE